ncbi:Mitochondrial protein cyt-4 [Phlyctema vagabunda]|uniref:Mitochondrial protein cyt-4 n=1 Tax=Phlyctema vagabunda TaxID=108571 RepID=A0ABR4PND2_9HELO
MLRISVPQTLSQPFICWRCRTSFQSRRTELPGISSRSSGAQSLRYATSVARARRKAPKTLPSHPPPSPRLPSSAQDTSPPQLFHAIGIRKYFKDWEDQNAASIVLPSELYDLPSPGMIRNSSNRTTDVQNVMNTSPDQEDSDVGGGMSGLADDVLDVGDAREVLLPGDLAIIPLVDGREEAAIFVRDVANTPNYTKRGQFFLRGGLWLATNLKNVKFHVPGFVDPAELDIVKPFIPLLDTLSPEASENILIRTVPSTAGRNLMQKMTRFVSAANTMYQANPYKFDTAHEHLASAKDYRRVTLHEAADVLVGNDVKKDQTGHYPPFVLYAVHSALIGCETGIRCQQRGGTHLGGQYEIAPLSELLNISIVVREVRQHLQYKVTRKNNPPKEPYKNSFTKFLERAQRLIDRSRALRDYTPHGTVGPVRNSVDQIKESKDATATDSTDPSTTMSSLETPSDVLSEIEKFNRFDLLYIRFLELWAGSESFPLQSYNNGIGSMILRETERYAFEDTKFDQTTAWTFLQEIGAIQPWANRATQMLRLDQPRDAIAEEPHDSYRTDIMQGIRKNWGELTIYCIDAVGANELDDGVSIEATDVADEYWVHIHTADPSSRIDPNGTLAKEAQSKWQTAYFADGIVSMLPDQYIKSELSLRKDRPCLTFSARLDKTGKILDTKITAGIVQNVVFLTPTVLDQLIRGQKDPSSKNIITVGSWDASSEPSRPMLKLEQLNSIQESELRLLNMIGEAFAKQRASRGGLPSRPGLQRSLSVSSPGFLLNDPPSRTSYEYRADPAIRLEVEKDGAVDETAKVETVQNLMVLAGHVAARWCHERGIPIPFRASAVYPGAPDSEAFYRNTVLPSLDAQGFAPAEIAMQYQRLCGPVVLSSVPGAHKALGLEKYSRCTSPLRRYEDLLLHWQVEAALLEERRIGETLVGNTKDDFLPFARANIDKILPSIAFGEKFLRQGMRFSEQAWLCRALLRAWKSGAEGLPPTFDFIVETISSYHQSMIGTVPFFLSRCMVQEEVPAYLKGKVNIGDVLEVELKDINVHSGRIEVRALRRLDGLRSQSTDKVGARTINHV